LAVGRGRVLRVREWDLPTHFPYIIWHFSVAVGVRRQWQLFNSSEMATEKCQMIFGK
jgi:hypothetical protein